MGNLYNEAQSTMTLITLHGELGEIVNRKNWKLKVNSVKEALHAIDVQSRNKLRKHFLEAQNKSLEYKVIVNDKEIEVSEDLNFNNLQTLQESELFLDNSNLRTLDIVPIIKGAGGGGGGQSSKGILGIILGVLLIAAGIALAFVSGPLGAAVIIAGIGLVAAGITILTMRSPEFEDFRKIDNGNGGKPSYLFDGPTNVLGEGGPVPVGYGKMKIGSQTIELSVSSFEVSNKLNTTDTRNKILQLQLAEKNQ